MSRRGQVTFLSPVRSDDGGDPQGPSSFLMLQPNNQGAAITLAYKTKKDARAARKALAMGDDVWAVDAIGLFEAIQIALEMQAPQIEVEPEEQEA